MLYNNIFSLFDKKQSEIMQKFIIRINEEDFSLPEQSAAECYILTDSLDAGFITEFAKKAKTQQFITLAETSETCLKFGLDGVLLDLAKSENVAADFTKQTDGLKGKFVGVICRNRRHEAMLASECEPDFVAFRAWCDGAEKIRALTDWYNEFFLIQSAIIPQDDSLDFTSFRTDFVILDDRKYKIFVAKA